MREMLARALHYADAADWYIGVPSVSYTARLYAECALSEINEAAMRI